MKRIILATAVAAIVAVSCSDDTTNPTTSSDSYLASGGGSEFIYNTQTTAKAQNGSDSLVGERTDTMRVSPTKRTMAGKEATQYITVSSDASVTPDTTYMYQDGSKIYMYFDLGSQVDVGGAQLPSLGAQWILVADANQTTWDAVTIPLENIAFSPSPGVELVLNGTIKVTGTKLGSETVSVNGSAISCIKYKQNVAGTITATSSAIPVPISIPISVVTETSFGKGIGVVKQVTPPTSVSFVGQSYDSDGESKILAKYTLK